jgi:hypothetical protein
MALCLIQYKQVYAQQTKQTASGGVGNREAQQINVINDCKAPCGSVGMIHNSLETEIWK